MRVETRSVIRSMEIVRFREESIDLVIIGTSDSENVSVMDLGFGRWSGQDFTLSRLWKDWWCVRLFLYNATYSMLCYDFVPSCRGLPTTKFSLSTSALLKIQKEEHSWFPPLKSVNLNMSSTAMHLGIEPLHHHSNRKFHHPRTIVIDTVGVDNRCYNPILQVWNINTQKKRIYCGGSKEGLK